MAIDLTKTYNDSMTGNSQDYNAHKIPTITKKKRVEETAQGASPIGLLLLGGAFAVLATGTLLDALSGGIIFSTLGVIEGLNTNFETQKIYYARKSEKENSTTPNLDEYNKNTSKTSRWAYAAAIPPFLALCGVGVVAIVEKFGLLSTLGITGKTIIASSTAGTLTVGALAPLLFSIPLLYGAYLSAKATIKAYRDARKAYWEKHSNNSSNGQGHDVFAVLTATFSGPVLANAAKTAGFLVGTAGIMAVAATIFHGVALGAVAALTTVAFPLAAALLGASSIYLIYKNWDKVKAFGNYLKDKITFGFCKTQANDYILLNAENNENITNNSCRNPLSGTNNSQPDTAVNNTDSNAPNLNNSSAFFTQTNNSEPSQQPQQNNLQENNQHNSRPTID